METAVLSANNAHVSSIAVKEHNDLVFGHHPHPARPKNAIGKCNKHKVSEMQLSV